MQNNFIDIFDKMNFFELVEKEDASVYCFETESDDRYLIASDELGNLPEEGYLIFIACYSAKDAFLWKLEFKDINALFAIYNESGDEKFISNLEKLL